MNFATHWGIGLQWASIPSLFVEDKEWELGTWPDIDLAEGRAEAIETTSWSYDETSSHWMLEDYELTIDDPDDEKNNNDSPDDPPGVIGVANIDLLIGVSLFGAVFVVITTKRKMNHS